MPAASQACMTVEPLGICTGDPLTLTSILSSAGAACCNDTAEDWKVCCGSNMEGSSRFCCTRLREAVRASLLSILMFCDSEGSRAMARVYQKLPQRLVNPLQPCSVIPA